MAGKQWGTTREKEDEHRRKLLSQARKGDLKAQDVHCVILDRVPARSPNGQAQIEPRLPDVPNHRADVKLLIGGIADLNVVTNLQRTVLTSSDASEEAKKGN